MSEEFLRFLNRKRVGLILRVFSSKEEDIPKRIEMTRKLVNKALAIELEGISIIKHIHVLVWTDPNYASDCGLTLAAMRQEFANDKRVIIKEVRFGDLFCGILNYGVAEQSRKGVDYSIIASTEADSYFTPKTIHKMLEAAAEGARGIGVAINELSEPIKAGRIANTLCAWHNISLLTVGGFDLRAAKPSKSKTDAEYLHGYHPDKGIVTYHLAGVEEVIPTARLIKTFGRCIAVIMPEGEGVQHYVVPNPDTEKELWLRHVSKMGTKLERQTALLATVGFDPSFLSGGIMAGYPR